MCPFKLVVKSNLYENQDSLKPSSFNVVKHFL